MFPHIGEIIMIFVIMMLIFGLGRLPYLSEQLARIGSPPQKSPPPDHTQILSDAQSPEDAQTK